mmetsp:Transcript_50686/g.147502  ORF Transcript_50686/g.147502 Transcript_50686/m.147502 type:complete len:232 (-) Transcript_50686:311-1006(-)
MHASASHRWPLSLDPESGRHAGAKSCAVPKPAQRRPGKTRPSPTRRSRLRGVRAMRRCPRIRRRRARGPEGTRTTSRTTSRRRTNNGGGRSKSERPVRDPCGSGRAHLRPWLRRGARSAAPQPRPPRGGHPRASGGPVPAMRRMGTRPRRCGAHGRNCTLRRGCHRRRKCGSKSHMDSPWTSRPWVLPGRNLSGTAATPKRRNPCHGVRKAWASLASQRSVPTRWQRQQGR